MSIQQFRDNIAKQNALLTTIRMLSLHSSIDDAAAKLLHGRENKVLSTEIIPNDLRIGNHQGLEILRSLDVDEFLQFSFGYAATRKKNDILIGIKLFKSRSFPVVNQLIQRLQSDIIVYDEYFRVQVPRWKAWLEAIKINNNFSELRTQYIQIYRYEMDFQKMMISTGLMMVGYARLSRIPLTPEIEIGVRKVLGANQ